MSNLTDLLPAGAGGKQVSLVASGTIGNGVTVALKTDGTVEAVGESTVPNSVGTATTFDTGYARFISATYDSVNNKVVVAYNDDGNLNYGTAVVGTVSGTSISFGTPVVFVTAYAANVSIVYASVSGKVVVSYIDVGNSSYGTARVGTVSGTSISFGTASVYHSVTVGEQTSTYSSYADKVIVWYQNGSNSYKGYASSGVISGTSITFASTTLIENAGSVDFLSVIAVPNSSTVVFSYRYQFAAFGYSWNWNISGTGFNSNNYAQFGGTPSYISTVWDSSAGKMILAYRKGGLSNYGVSYVADVTATDVTFGSEVVFNSGTTAYISTVFDQNINKPIILYQDNSNFSYGTLRVGTVSGTSISFDSEFVFNNTETLFNSAVYSTTDQKIVIAYADNAFFGKGVVLTPSYVGTNSSDFIGISDAAISDTASGSVTIKGGVSSNVSKPITPVFGATSTSSADNTDVFGAVYSSIHNKTVLIYRDDDNSNYGTAVVATNTSGSFSYGTPVVFNSNYTSAENTSAVFDPSSGKVFIAYEGASAYGTARMASIVGTGLSMGTQYVFNSASTGDISAVYNSNQNKVVVCYRDGGASNGARAVVASVSGSSISYGAEYSIENESYEVKAASSTTTNQIFVAFQTRVNNPYYGRCKVLTVSGTVLTVGTPFDFADAVNGSEAKNIACAYEPNSARFVVAYNDIGTATGLVKSFSASGTTVTLQNTASLTTSWGEGISYTEMAYDAGLQKMYISYRSATATANQGRVVLADIGASSISVSSTITTASGNYFPMDYDSSAQKTVIAYNDFNNLRTVTTAQLSGEAKFIAGQNYYVQADGSLATTSSSVLAGKAISSTSINLDYTT